MDMGTYRFTVQYSGSSVKHGETRRTGLARDLRGRSLTTATHGEGRSCWSIRLKRKSYWPDPFARARTRLTLGPVACALGSDLVAVGYDTAGAGRPLAAGAERLTIARNSQIVDLFDQRHNAVGEGEQRDDLQLVERGQAAFNTKRLDTVRVLGFDDPDQSMLERRVILCNDFVYIVLPGECRHVTLRQSNQMPWRFPDCSPDTPQPCAYRKFRRDP